MSSILILFLSHLIFFNFNILFFLISCLLVYLSKEDFKNKEVSSYLLLLLLFMAFFLEPNHLNFIQLKFLNDNFFIHNLINGTIFIGLLTLLNIIVSYVKNVETTLGDGDLPIFFLIGVLFSFFGIITIFVSTLLAFFYSIIKKEKEIPLIPFLTIGIFITFFIVN